MATNKKCPKCGSKNFQVVAYSIVGYIYEVEDGRVIADGQDDGDSKDVRVNCVCRECEHQWHPKRLNDDFVIDE